MTDTDVEKLRDRLLQAEGRVILLQSVVQGWLQHGDALDRRRPRGVARDAAKDLVVQGLSHERATRLFQELFPDGQLDEPEDLTS